MPRFRMLVAVLATTLAAAGCTTPTDAADPSSKSPTPARPRPVTALPSDSTTVVAGKDAAELAIATSRALYTSAPAVVLVGVDDEASMAAAGTAAVQLGVPLLLTPEADSVDATSLRAELSRLAPRSLVPIGDPATRWAHGESPVPGKRPATIVPDAGRDGGLPDVAPAPPLPGLLVLALAGRGSEAARTTARASGARIVLMSSPDPRTDDDVIKALAGQPTQRVLALGSAFGPTERLRRRVDTAATGVLLPGGGQVVFPGRRIVALYGHPGDPRLGVLGEQPLDAAITRARRVAVSYRSLVDEPVVPAFEIIATVASSSAGPDGDYSSESTVALLRPWVEGARKAGVYVVLDLQPGRTDFLTQAKRYRDLLKEPNVALALDPEWRLKPGQRHMEQIGSVGAAEINRTAAWLAGLTREHKLPQKVLLLHQFWLNMITNREHVRTDYDELQVVIHADGFGTAQQKFNTWDTLHVNAPPDVWWGWKNFYDEDQPTFTPRQTVAVRPAPVFISYQ